MFTGIIEEVGRIQKIEDQAESVEIRVQCSFADQLEVDQSVSVNGVCLTVTEKNNKEFAVDCIKETLRKTTLSTVAAGDPVNLERSLTLDKGVDGHLVQGHVDRLARITNITEKEDDRLYEVEIPSEDADMIVSRGSITLDGVSLTIARLSAQNRLVVAVIPYTYRHTNFQEKESGDAVNIEYDIIGKYVVRYMENRQDPAGRADTPNAQRITKEWLKSEGY